MYEFGKIIMVPFPFTNLRSSKIRPALIISTNNDKREDIIVAFISSKTNKINKDQFFISTEDQFFSQTGLKVNSMLFLDKIATLDKQLILGEIGFLKDQTLKDLATKFYNIFGF